MDCDAIEDKPQIQKNEPLNSLVNANKKRGII